MCFRYIFGYAGVLGGLLVAAIGYYATTVFNERSRVAKQQQKDRATIAEELQTVEKFLPDLASSDERINRAAILAVSLLGNHELGAKLTELSIV